LDILKNKKSLDNFLFKIEMKSTYLLYFKMNLNYLVTIESPKLLSVYNLCNSKKVASFPLYCEVKALHVTEEYVAIGMVNRRVISYLIVNENNLSIIKQLESRQTQNIDQSTKKKVKKMLGNLNKLMDGSNEDELHEIDCLVFNDEVPYEPSTDEEEEQERAERIKYLRKQVIKYPLRKLDVLTLISKDLNENWLIEKIKADKNIIDYELDEEQTSQETMRKMLENEKEKVEANNESQRETIKTSQACSLM
jgi:hypothetical protein